MYVVDREWLKTKYFRASHAWRPVVTDNLMTLEKIRLKSRPLILLLHRIIHAAKVDTRKGTFITVRLLHFVVVKLYYFINKKLSNPPSDSFLELRSICWYSLSYRTQIVYSNKCFRKHFQTLDSVGRIWG